MTKTAENVRHYAVLDVDRERYGRFLGERVHVCGSRDEIAALYAQHREGLTWLAYARRYTDELLKAAANVQAAAGQFAARRDDWVLTVAAPRAASVPALHGLFRRVIGDSPSYRWLAKDVLNEVLLDGAGENIDLFIAVAADPVTRTLSLVGGDCRQLVVPFSLFPRAGDGTVPDFSDPRPIDYGRTIALGDYETAADAILYETDTEYRKRLKRARKESERSFGASLLRMRKQRRLRRDDFTPLSAKTIARIERSEIGKPHGKTLQTIADRLGVAPQDIADF